MKRKNNQTHTPRNPSRCWPLGMKTTTSCSGCGKAIPESIVGDATCVACRYHSAPPKSETTQHSDKRFELAATTAALTEPDESDARNEIVSGLLRLLAGDSDHATCGRRLIVTAYLSGALPDCSTDRELAKRLNISPGRVSQIIAEIRSKIPSLAKCKRRQAIRR